MMQPSPPSNIDAEESLLSAILIDNDVWIEIADQQLRPEDFYKTAHQKIFESMGQLFDNNEPIDLVMLNNALTKSGSLAKCGGPAYIAQLVDNIPMAVDAPHYAAIVKDLAIKRNLIAAHNKNLRKIFKPDVSAEQALSLSLTELSFVADTATLSNSLGKIGDALPDTFDKYQNACKAPGGITGLSTGFDSLDELTLGLQPSDLIIIAARPSVGKTAFALNLCRNICNEEKTVLFFSLEMSKDRLLDRLLGMESGMPINASRQGNLTPDGWKNLNDAGAVIDAWKFYVDDRSSISAQTISLVAKKLNRTEKIDLIVIDYMQLAALGHGDTRNNLIGNFTRQMKSLAKDLSVRVVALSQLNRKLEERNNKRPKLSDLRESGNIEQDADLVMFLYRDEIYNKDANNPYKGTAEVILSKHRDGPTGTINLMWHDNIQLFS